MRYPKPLLTFPPYVIFIAVHLIQQCCTASILLLGPPDSRNSIRWQPQLFVVCCRYTSSLRFYSCRFHAETEHDRQVATEVWVELAMSCSCTMFRLHSSMPFTPALILFTIPFFPFWLRGWAVLINAKREYTSPQVAWGTAKRYLLEQPLKLSVLKKVIYFRAACRFFGRVP